MDNKTALMNRTAPARSNLSLALAAITAAGGGMALPNFAHAQLEEVVVTARARSESLQDVPATVTACLLYTSPSPRDTERSRMPSSA